ncbi:MAG: 50S ribosomal protein L23 [Elusimicrobia bacterium HGW-Elusimicrobia-1]|jgi:large subunit ribosomal protein L23|nr:MAG: 50S ribosomal protein L23 [Elusimicrobia bacterium HGW-Elusimicrobia-1]
MEIYEIIKSPVVTEKAAAVKERDNCYVFRVARTATKGQIKEAVTEMFKVKVAKVRTVILPGKYRRMGAYGGYKPDFKKAYVTLKEGQTIKIGE